MFELGMAVEISGTSGESKGKFLIKDIDRKNNSFTYERLKVGSPVLQAGIDR